MDFKAEDSIVKNGNRLTRLKHLQSIEKLYREFTDYPLSGFVLTELMKTSKNALGMHPAQRKLMMEKPSRVIPYRLPIQRNIMPRLRMRMPWW